MKRFVLILCLLLLCGCTRTETEVTDGNFLFFYRTEEISYGTADGVIAAETVSIDAAQIDLAELMEQYLNGPVSSGLIAAVPEQWVLQTAYLDVQTAVLVFADKGETSPLEQTVADACLTRTLLQLPSVERVSITMQGQSETRILGENDILLSDTGMETPQEELTLYFPDAECRYLQHETLKVNAMDAEEKAAYILNRLLNEQENGNIRSGIPAGTQLLDIRVENGVCTVDLSSEFKTKMGLNFKRERLAIYAMVNSLTELPEITTVDLWVAGAPLERLYVLDLSAGLARDESLIAKTEQSEWLDITIYPVEEQSGLLVPIPRREKQTEEAEELALQALFSFSPVNGIYNCVPASTKVLSVKVENGVCTVDFSGEFLETSQEVLAVRSVIATLTALPEIDSVEIFVEGMTPEFQNTYLSRVRTPQTDWIAK